MNCNKSMHSFVMICNKSLFFKKSQSILVSIAEFVIYNYIIYYQLTKMFIFNKTDNISWNIDPY